MKSALALATLVASLAFAPAAIADVVKTIDSSLAQNLVSSLAMNGIKLKKKSPTLATVSVKGLGCVYHSNYNQFDNTDPGFGIWSQVCRAGIEGAFEGGGKKLRDTGVIVSALEAAGYEMDCAMGKCAIFVKEADCSMKLGDLGENEERFRCAITTEY